MLLQGHRKSQRIKQTENGEIQNKRTFEPSASHVKSNLLSLSLICLVLRTSNMRAIKTDELYDEETILPDRRTFKRTFSSLNDVVLYGKMETIQQL